VISGQSMPTLQVMQSKPTLQVMQLMPALQVMQLMPALQGIPPPVLTAPGADPHPRGLKQSSNAGGARLVPTGSAKSDLACPAK
jgi:hypothetical protein